MGGKIDALLKLCVIASVASASASAVYYYSVYLPRRDAQLDAERTIEKSKVETEKRAEREQADAEKLAEQVRALSQQRELEQRQSAEKAAVQVRYKACLKRASDNYDASWAAYCKRRREFSAKGYADCLKGGPLPI